MESITVPFWAVTLILGGLIGFVIAVAIWAAYDIYTTSQAMRKDRELRRLTTLIRSVVNEELNKKVLERELKE